MLLTFRCNTRKISVLFQHKFFLAQSMKWGGNAKQQNVWSFFVNMMRHHSMLNCRWGWVDGAKFEVALNNKLRWWRAMQSNPMNTKLPPFVPVRQCLTNVCQLECAPIPWPRPTNAPVVPPKNPVCLTPPKLRLPPTALEDGVGFLTFFRQEGLESNRRGRWGSASV